MQPCGHTPNEAREKGCRFGMLNFAWVPEACYDEEIEEQFRNYADWGFWRFPNRTGWVSWDEAAKGEFDLLFIEWECEFPSRIPFKNIGVPSGIFGHLLLMFKGTF